MKLDTTSRALVLSHFMLNPTISGATSTSICDYLKQKIDYVLQVEQPFIESKESKVFVQEYFQGNKMRRHTYTAIKIGGLSYILHVVQNLLILFRFGLSYDIVVACDNVSFLSIYLLRKMGFIQHAIYYSVDYVEVRFSNKFVNAIYHYIDRLAIYNSDENWVVSQAQIDSRKRNNVNIKKASRFKVVPIGFPVDRKYIKSVDQVDFYHLVFAGTLRDSAGPSLAVEALPDLLKVFPKLKITYVGGGDKKPLIAIAKELGVLSHISIQQNITDHTKFIKKIADKSIGIAPYAPVEVSISYTSDPGKIKLYLLCGLPVITTTIATSHTLIENNMAGISISYNKDQFVKAVIKILQNKGKYAQYKKSAIKLGKSYDTDIIFSKAFK